MISSIQYNNTISFILRRIQNIVNISSFELIFTDNEYVASLLKRRVRIDGRHFRAAVEVYIEEK